MKIRDRIIDFRRIPADQLQPNPKNWRKHPQAQQDALRGILAEVGYAEAVLARETPEGGLMLIDGHLRAETDPQGLIPTLVLDVDEAEAAKLLATFDPLAAMTEADGAKLDALLREVDTESEPLKQMLADLATSQPIDLSDPPESVEENVAEIEEIKRQRKKGNVETADKNDTEKYLVVVFPSRAAKNEQLARLGLPADERYVSASAIEIRSRGKIEPVKAKGGRPARAANSNKSGAGG